MNETITIENVNLWYDKDKPSEVHALKNVSLGIKKGDYVAFFGPSGCGKTTVLYSIAGIDRYQSGRILINGRDITGLSNKELAIFRQTGVGIIFQQFNLVPSLTVLQNVSLPMAFVGISSEKSETEARKLLERLNITEFADRYPFELSGGQQQRVGIARALANNPPIIIADEPLGNLDSANAKNVLEFLKELNEKDGRTIIMVTHEAWSLRDVKTIFYMKDGAITGVEEQTAKTIAGALSERLYKELAAAKPEEAPTEDGVYARALSNFLLRGYSMEEIRRFEQFLKQRLTGEIGALEFYQAIDRGYKEGGVGLWKKKAERIAIYIENVIEKRKDVEAVHTIIEKYPELPIMEEVQRIRRWLVEEYDGKISDFQALALDQLVSDRLREYITLDQMRLVLDRSKNEFGVGLSFRAAQRIADKMESIMTGNAEPGARFSVA